MALRSQHGFKSSALPSLTVSPEGVVVRSGASGVSLWERSHCHWPLSDLHSCLSTLATPPLASMLSLRTGLLSHLLRALTGCRDPTEVEGEPGLDWAEACWEAAGGPLLQ